MKWCHDFLCPAGGEGTADWVPEYGGKPGGPGQGCGAAPPPQGGEHSGNHYTHQSHLWLQTDRGMRAAIFFFYFMSMLVSNANLGICSYSWVTISHLTSMLVKDKKEPCQEPGCNVSPLTSPLCCFNPHNQTPPLCPALPLQAPYCSCFLETLFYL